MGDESQYAILNPVVGIRDYLWLVCGFEHTRNGIRERILNADTQASYLLYAMRGNGVQMVRARYHGVDLTQVGFLPGLQRMLLLRKAHSGSEADLDALLEHFCPRYHFPSENVWQLRPRYLEVLEQQGRVTREQREEYVAAHPQAVVPEPSPSAQGSGQQSSSWSFFGLFGSSGAEQQAPAPAAPSRPAEPAPEWSRLLESGLQRDPR